MMYYYPHTCVKNLRQLRQLTVSSELRPSLTCEMCGERFTVGEAYDNTIYFSEIKDPMIWFDEDEI